MDINEILSKPKRRLKTRTPDFILKAMNKVTDQKTGKIGAAWKNKDGSISLVLDLGVQIHQEPNIVIMLFPNDRPEEGQDTSQRKKKTMADLPTSTLHKIKDT